MASCCASRSWARSARRSSSRASRRTSRCSTRPASARSSSSAMRHFLYLTNTRLVSLVAQGKRIVARREFAVSGAGAAAFEAYLTNLRDARTHLFVDLAEEDFRLDTIPHVGAAD